MRYAIFSDIHSNLEALEAVLAFYKEQQLDRVICLGDVVGYGADPNRCCDLVREVADVTILGNHDAAVCGRMDYSYYYEAARDALDWTHKTLTPEHVEWLASLPYFELEDDIMWCHGSPLGMEAFDYMFSLEQALMLTERFEEMKRVTFIGHSHLTISFAYTPEGARRILYPSIDTNTDEKFIITVGSVGQPRDYDCRACCTIYDSESRILEYHRLDYDVSQAAEKIINTPILAPSFGKRLFLGI